MTRNVPDFRSLTLIYKERHFSLFSWHPTRYKTLTICGEYPSPSFNTLPQLQNEQRSLQFFAPRQSLTVITTTLSYTNQQNKSKMFAKAAVIALASASIVVAAPVNCARSKPSTYAEGYLEDYDTCKLLSSASHLS